ncbi:MAG TPA: zinc ribbon domain-containing protein [Blastocatellia bacterium]|nr:zinc ribbon domain-containing protein [Blastocatellia bacterium]
MDSDFSESYLRADAGGTNGRSSGALEVDLYADLEAFIEHPPDLQMEEETVRCAPDFAAPATTPLTKPDTADLVKPAPPARPATRTGGNGSSRPAAPSPPARFIRCPACGTDANSHDLFCLACGGFLDELDATGDDSTRCNDCGSAVAAGEVFCPSCGSISRR